MSTAKEKVPGSENFVVNEERSARDQEFFKKLTSRRIIVPLLSDLDARDFSDQPRVIPSVNIGPLARVVAENILQELELTDAVELTIDRSPLAINPHITLSEEELSQRHEVTGYTWKTPPSGEIDSLKDKLDRLMFQTNRAEEALIASQNDLVAFVARKQVTTMPLEDMIGYGNIRLAKVIQSFDWRRGYALSSLLLESLDGEMKRAIRDFDSLIKRPRSAHELHGKITAIRRSLHDTLDRPPSRREIEDAAVEAGFGREAIRKLIDYGNLVYLDAPVTSDEGDRTLFDSLGEEDKGYQDTLLYDLLARVNLTDREKLILRWRFFPPNGKVKTQAEIGTMLGVTKMAVSLAERRLMERLGAMINETD
jgi:RNA polymerase sigma factor (sigma-70 family)